MYLICVFIRYNSCLLRKVKYCTSIRRKPTNRATQYSSYRVEGSCIRSMTKGTAFSRWPSVCPTHTDGHTCILSLIAIAARIIWLVDTMMLCIFLLSCSIGLRHFAKIAGSSVS